MKSLTNSVPKYIANLTDIPSNFSHLQCTDRFQKVEITAKKINSVSKYHEIRGLSVELLASCKEAAERVEKFMGKW